MTSAGFSVNEVDRYMYYHYGGGEVVILCLYVSDILIFGKITDVIDEIEVLISMCFDMKELEQVDIIINIKLIKKEDRINLSKYK